MVEAGFGIWNDVFDEGECDLLVNELERTTHKTTAGIRNLMANPVVRTFANDSRLNDVKASFSEGELIPFKATLFSKTGKANWLVAWHQDTALPVERVPSLYGWGPASVKDGVKFVHAPTDALSKILAIRIHLDASTDANGPLRVIPGSHERRITNDDKFRLWMSCKSVKCCAAKGGVIAMSPLLIHASSKCVKDEPRRVLHIEYAPSLDIAAGVRLAIA